LRLAYFSISIPYILVASFLFSISRRFRNLERKVSTKVISSESNFPEIYLKVIQIAEDHRGDKHFGIDYLSFARILKQYFWDANLQGGSTIEQQLVRTLTGRYEITIKRKLVEQLLAILISYRFSKLQIVSSYLNHAYLGTNITGLSELAKKLKLDIEKDSLQLAVEYSVRLKYPEPSKVNEQWLLKYERRKVHILNLLSKKFLPPHTYY